MRGFACSLAIALIAGRGEIAWGYSPESPEVRRMVAAALHYLDESYQQVGELDNRLGGKALIGLAMLKGGMPQHDFVEEAAEDCRLMGTRPAAEITTSVCDIYSTGLAIIFLCELDASRFRDSIETLVRSLELRQKDHGGWGYAERDTGDTSMTQYGALSLWTARQHGIAVSSAALQGYANWLLATQDLNGGWGYQGRIASGGTLVPQDRVTVSLTSAALGSLLIFTDAAGLRVGSLGGRDLPTVVRPVGAERRVVLSGVGRIRQAVRNGDAWLGNSFQIEGTEYTYYYLYALERYQSFRELGTGSTAWSRNWYDEGVRYLAEKQERDGAWSGGNSRSEIGTAFAILFLTRSTKRTLEKVKNFGDGALRGGRGLPSNTDEVFVVGGTIVTPELEGPGDDLMALLDDPANPDLDYLADNVDALEPRLNDDYSDEDLERLRDYVGAEAPEVRLIALRALGRRRNLDDAPRLIYALSDPDPRIVREANSALRRTFRVVRGFELPRMEDREGRRALIERWTELLQTIRPDVVMDAPPSQPSF